MVWSEYLNEQHTYEQVHTEEDDQDTPPPCDPLDFNDWVDWYEPHISNMWRDFSAYREDACINKIVGKDVDFWDFARFLYNSSDHRPIPIE